MFFLLFWDIGMGRRYNLELRRAVLNLYVAGLAPREIVDHIALRMGRRYSVAYIRKLLWDMRRRGILAKASGRTLWDDVEVLAKALNIRCTALEEEVRSVKWDRDKILEHLEALDKHVADLVNAVRLLRLAYDRTVSSRVVT